MKERERKPLLNMFIWINRWMNKGIYLANDYSDELQIYIIHADKHIDREMIKQIINWEGDKFMSHCMSKELWMENFVIL